MQLSRFHTRTLTFLEPASSKAMLLARMSYGYNNATSGHEIVVCGNARQKDLEISSIQIPVRSGQYWERQLSPHPCPNLDLITYEYRDSFSRLVGTYPYPAGGGVDPLLPHQVVPGYSLSEARGTAPTVIGWAPCVAHEYRGRGRLTSPSLALGFPSPIR
eukprot:2235599-Rhodomonas_salina.3